MLLELEVCSPEKSDALRLYNLTRNCWNPPNDSVSDTDEGVNK